MNLIKRSLLCSALCLAVLPVLIMIQPVSAATWIGTSTITNGWSDGPNWDINPNIPGASDTVTFNASAVTNVNGAINNVIDSNYTILSLTYSALVSAGTHTAFINADSSLNINGSGGNALFVGAGVAITTDTVYSRFVGPGTLTVTNPTGAITIYNMGTAVPHRATLDLSGLTNFAASVSQIVIAGSATTGESTQMGAMLLAETNVIQTAAGTTKPGLLVASQANGSTGTNGTQQLFLGRNNIINSDAITVGGAKQTAHILFRTGMSGATATLRGSAGGSDRVKLLSVGDGTAGVNDYARNGTGNVNFGLLDGTANMIDALVSDLYVGRSQNSGNGSTTGVLILDQGTIDADNVFVGAHPVPSSQAGNTFNAIGTIIVTGNANLTVNNDLMLGRKGGTNIPIANLTVSSNGTVNVKGNITVSNSVSTITLNGGLINMQPAGDGTPGNVAVGTLTGSGTITNAANVTNTLSLNPGTAVTAATLSIAGNLVLSNGAAVTFNITNDATIGSGLNDLINVTGNVSFNNNLITFIPTALSLANGSYRLFNYSGSRSGALSFTNPTHYTASIDYSTANQVNAVVSGSPASVRWNSASSTAWDTTTSNWFNTGTAAVDRYGQFDSVLVDASGAYTNFLSLNTIIFPGAVTVNSSSRDYIFGGPGRISGPVAFSKSGTSMLTITNNNDFTGPVTVSGGILKVGNATALGTTASGTVVTNGGTLDINGIALNNPGEFMTISGAGLNNTGAVINAGAQQTSGLRFVTLADNASMGCWGNRYDIRGPGGGNSFSAELNLNGYTLTKVGGGQFVLVDTLVTNSGNIVVNGGIFDVARCQVGGPGTINILSNILYLEAFTTGYVSKPIISSGGTIRANVAGTLWAPVTNLTGLRVETTNTLTFTNVITGAGGLTHSAPGTSLLLAANTYTGPTTIIGGRVTLGTNGSIASSSGINVTAGATFDVTAVSGFSLATGQTLSGSGAVLGDLTAPAANTIIPGSSPGTLSFSNSVTFTSTTNIFELASDPTQVGNGVNDLISVAGNLTLNGNIVLKIVPIGPLDGSIPYVLMTNLGTFNFAGATFQIISDNPRYTFTLVDPNTTPNSLQVSVSGVPTTLTWRGGQLAGPTLWNGTLSNWLNGASADTFFSGDSVFFDDSALTNLVTLPAQLSPASMTVSNETKAYQLGGAGGITAGALLKQGASSLSYTNAGLLSYGGGMSLSAGTVTLANGSNNTFGGTVSLNSGAVTFANNGVNNFNSFAVSSGTAQFANVGANSFASPIALDGGTLSFNQSADAIIITALTNSVPTIAGTLAKNGPNTLTLAGNSAAFDGPIVVNNGILRAGNANALGTINNGTTVAAGATLDINGTSLFNPGDIITISGEGLNGTGAVMNAGAAQNNALRGISLAADATVSAWGNRWDVRGPGGAGSFSGSLALNNFNLTKLGSGQFTVVDANVTDAAIINVLGGIISFARTSVPNVGSMLLSNNILVFDNYASGSFSMPITVNGGTIRAISSAAFSFDSVVTNLAGGVTYENTAGVIFTGAGSIRGPGQLTKIGTGQINLTSLDNAWSGGTTIGAGGLQIGSGAADGSLPDLPITNNGTLAFSSLNSLVVTSSITGSGGITQPVGGTVLLGGSNSYAGTTALASTTDGTRLRITNSFALGTVAGITTLNGGTAARSVLELAGNILVPEIFQFAGRQGGSTDLPHINNFSDTNTLTGQINGATGGTEYNLGSDAGKLIVAANFVPPATVATRDLKLLGPGLGEYSGIISNSTDGIVPALLTKKGSGTWTLSGANVYFGATTIVEGTLAIAATGSINATPSIDVQAGATFDVTAVPGSFIVGATNTLKGNGTVLGNVTVNGTVAPGESIGTLTFANSVVLAGTSSMEINRDVSPNADLIVANSLTYGGSLLVNNIGSSLQTGDTFNLFDWTSRSGSFASTTLPPLDPGLSWDTSQLAVTGTISVVGSGINTTRTNLSIFVTGNSLDISWPADHAGWRLESQTNTVQVGLSNNWATVPNSTTTNHMVIPISPANGAVFFRMAYP